MGAIAGTVVKISEFGGVHKLAVVTATIASASDTIDLSGTFSTITGILGCVITGGQDDGFLAASASFSGTTVTVTSVEEGGAAADEFTGTTVSIGVMGSASGI